MIKAISLFLCAALSLPAAALAQNAQPDTTQAPVPQHDLPAANVSIKGVAPGLAPPQQQPPIPTYQIPGVAVDVTASAPVQQPYGGTAYRTLAGQPETSADALFQQPSDSPPSP